MNNIRFRLFLGEFFFKKKFLDGIFPKNSHTSLSVIGLLSDVFWISRDCPIDLNSEVAYHEQLDFNPYEFDNFFKQLLNRKSSIFTFS
ncbi:MAG: hypothetical protein ACFFAG_19395 [Promethearchaeota archaeon]